MNFTQLLARLALRRPLFHSEADFQHALAWEIHERHPAAQVRLEYRPKLLRGRIYVDIWVELDSGPTIAIELKYKTRPLVWEREGESYELLNQSAQDAGRYDFLKDVRRIEQLAQASSSVCGAAILLTNDPSYWQTPRPGETADAAFRLHEGQTISGELGWGSGASPGTMRSREAPLTFGTAYRVSWRSYSRLEAPRYGEFRYLLIEVLPSVSGQSLA
jgi:hypothetical protein